MNTTLKSLPTSDQSFGDASVSVEYEIEPGEDGGRDSPSWEASVTVTGVYINGCFVEADLFLPATVAKWEEAIYDELASDSTDEPDPDDSRDECREWAGMEQSA